MDSFAKNLGAVAILLAAVTIVVLNDRFKERAARKAIEKGRRPPARWANHRTSWPLVATYVVFAGLLLLAAALVPGRAMSRGVICLVILGAFGLVALGGWIWRRVRSGRSRQHSVAAQPREAADPVHAIAPGANRSSIPAVGAAGPRRSGVWTFIRLVTDTIRSRQLPTFVWSGDGWSAKLKCPRCHALVELRMGANGERAFECSSCGESGVWQGV
jgi:hypothetical protein